MKNKLKNINFYKEIYLKCNTREINSFDHAVFRINTKDIYARSERVVCKIYIMPNEKKVSLGDTDNQFVSDTLLMEIKGKRSGWIEWTIDSQLKEFMKNEDLLLKIVLADY